MDYKNKLQTNNTALEGNNLDLQTILNTINSLPEAGSGESVNLDAEITAQDAVIAQIQSALEGKAASGGSASIDTCTIIPFDSGNFGINNVPERYLAYTFTTINDGVITIGDAGYRDTMSNVICGSVLHIDATMSEIDPANLRLDGEESYSWFNEGSAIFIVPYKNGETISFTLEQ